MRNTHGADVRLRSLREADAADVLAAFRSNPDMARQGEVASLADAERYVRALLRSDGNQIPFALAVDDRLVGLVCVTADPANRSGWFWYWMSEDARCKGWMARAAATVADWALTVGGLDRLELGHRVNNPASGRVARVAGFVKEGTERGKFLIDGERIDVDTYGRLRSDPFPEAEPVPFLDR
ncbi:GNAT family N-acetyltransferase [Zhihengliuella halotolerans]|uniref:RimJ/RimL family protein N-acetyltransferase n=1 Tax=Zhihengliuella halotolerans TaxID=370736 RepID=A0A4Q8ABD6_9MICC|nr:GNAT family protein [Zhihengliuella halotolerans]RZU60971.1 RimJ/RimL family protein N-acetyltransferase [Zhihengliuella halotolerans]